VSIYIKCILHIHFKYVNRPKSEGTFSICCQPSKPSRWGWSFCPNNNMPICFEAYTHILHLFHLVINASYYMLFYGLSRTALLTDIYQTRTSKQAGTARTYSYSHVGRQVVFMCLNYISDTQPSGKSWLHMHIKTNTENGSVLTVWSLFITMKGALCGSTRCSYVNHIVVWT
jgi:hypothetical protein